MESATIENSVLYKLVDKNNNYLKKGNITKDAQGTIKYNEAANLIIESETLVNDILRTINLIDDNNNFISITPRPAHNGGDDIVYWNTIYDYYIFKNTNNGYFKIINQSKNFGIYYEKNHNIYKYKKIENGLDGLTEFKLIRINFKDFNNKS